MEVKEAIDKLEYYQDYCDGWSISLDKKDLEEFENIISLLQSLETTIKGCETAYTRAVLEKDKLSKELEAYKEMWKNFKETNGFRPLEYFISAFDTTIQERMEQYEKEYLGGGEDDQH